MLHKDQKETLFIAVVFLAIASLWLFCGPAKAESGATWSTGTFEASPAGSDLASTIDNQIRELKTTTREYAETEMCWSANDTDGCPVSNNGRLREGACRVFLEDTEPATLNAADFPPGSTALDGGRLWADSNDSNQLYVYDAAFEEVDGVPAADRTNWNASDTQLDEHLLAVKATLSGTYDASAANCASPLAIVWDTESFDDNTMHDTVTSDTTRRRLVTPVGSTRVRLQAYIHGGTDNGTTLRLPWAIRQDGTTEVAVVSALNGNANGQSAITIDTGPITVTGGTTYFEVIPSSNASFGCSLGNGTAEVVQTDSYFTLEVIK